MGVVKQYFDLWVCVWTFEFVSTRKMDIQQEKHKRLISKLMREVTKDEEQFYEEEEIWEIHPLGSFRTADPVRTLLQCRITYKVTNTQIPTHHHQGGENIVKKINVLNVNKMYVESFTLRKWARGGRCCWAAEGGECFDSRWRPGRRSRRGVAWCAANPENTRTHQSVMRTVFYKTEQIFQFHTSG